MTDAEKLARLRAIATGHRFDYQEHDTGVWKCQHSSHMGGYLATCSRAQLTVWLEALDREDS